MQLRGGGPILADFFAKIGPPWGIDFGKRGPFLAAKIGPAGPNLAAKVVRGDRFWQLFFAKISPAGPVLGGTDFGVTVQSVKCYDSGLRSTELIDRPKYVCILQKGPRLCSRFDARPRSRQLKVKEPSFVELLNTILNSLISCTNGDIAM